MSEDKKLDFIKCPYCAEEIRQEAIACKHCGKDLHFFKPLFEKISGLEKKLTQVIQINETYKEIVSRQHTTVPNSHIQERYSFLHWRHLVVIVISVLSFTIIEWLLEQTPDNSFWENFTVFFLLLSPLPTYIWYGLSVKGKHLKLYVLGGIATGMLNFFVDRYIVTSATDWESHRLVYLFFIFVLFGVIMSVWGGVIGDWIETRNSSNKRHTVAEEIAAKIMGGSNKGLTDEENIKKMSRLVILVRTLIPLFALFLSFIGSYFKLDVQEIVIAIKNF